MNIWSRLGLSVAIASAFCIVVMEVFQNKTYYQLFKWYASGTFAGAGILLLLVGRHLASKYRPARSATEVHGAQDEQPTASSSAGSQFSFWGPLLVVFGAIVSLLPYKEETAVAAAREPTPPPPEVAPAEPVSFPELKIQGIVYRPPRSAVIIEGKSFFEGDEYRGAEIVGIDSTSVTLGLNGARKVVALEE